MTENREGKTRPFGEMSAGIDMQESSLEIIQLLEQESSKEILRQVLVNARFEIFPSTKLNRQVRTDTKNPLSLLPSGSKISVTCPPEDGINKMLHFTENLDMSDLHVTPHIAARHVRDLPHLNEILERILQKDINEIFVIGGDLKESVGDFRSSVDILQAIKESGYHFDQIGVGAYPGNKHSHIDAHTLVEDLKIKSQENLATYASTQMAFEADEIIEWAADMRAEGVEIPFDIGLSGPVTIINLVKFAQVCGVKTSLSFLRKHTKSVASLANPTYDPNKILLKLLPYFLEEGSGMRGLHLYTFNQIESSQKWRQELLDSLA